ncbi:hypothetical protein LK07_03615 [Streptomyces pluripotens]|uniref:STAS domain-containing protein n=1 Tax=Streptomyces pluripotens TaxID=1355015 RepID=A0A221NTN0_9ACTN|nr:MULTISPECIES: hypothetical protein [Streptomyces]ARP69013.1 hypothetical protein LK06_002530 [Streptomyces pluripotens]ASN23272.1 hypothetical protein LK07_03615 [Streptomyces pluripotens]MCH0560981.1 hypothetical protein [Streptomyces sp. MUM 16J]
METVTFALSSIPSGSGAFLADQLAALLTARPDAAVVVCDVSAVDQPRAADLDHLAWLKLTTRRAGRDFVLQGVGTRLRLLLALTGFGEVLDAEPGGPSAHDGDGGRPAGKPS